MEEYTTIRSFAMWAIAICTICGAIAVLFYNHSNNLIGKERHDVLKEKIDSSENDINENTRSEIKKLKNDFSESQDSIKALLRPKKEKPIRKKIIEPSKSLEKEKFVLKTEELIDSLTALNNKWYSLGNEQIHLLDRIDKAQNDEIKKQLDKKINGLNSQLDQIKGMYKLKYRRKAEEYRTILVKKLKKDEGEFPVRFDRPVNPISLDGIITYLTELLIEYKTQD